MLLPDLKNVCRGGRCVLVGNGPSLNRQDLGMMANETLWCFNRGYLLFDRIAWRPDFYLSMDPNVLRNSIDDIRYWVKQLSKTRFILPVWLKEDNLLEEAANIVWFNQRSEPYNSNNWDMSIGLCLAHTVAAVAISLAVDMGFSKIILVGCDMSYSSVKPGACLNTCIQKDQDHFDERYLISSGTWTTPDIDGMLNDYRQALKHARSKHASVINATDGGMLDVFERQPYSEIFAESRISLKSDV